MDFVVTEDWIVSNSSDFGGWTRIQLGALGVDWPPIAGWKQRVIGRRISEEHRLVFERKLRPERQAAPSKRAARKLRRERIRADAKKPDAVPPPKQDDFYSSWAWVELRYEVLKKHGPRCMLCGVDSRHARIVVDHIKPRRLFPALELEFSNMQVLCDPCNRGKGFRDDTDWRDLSEELEESAAAHMREILNS